MRIRKLNATFGKLQNESLQFHGGLNVIYAPNESGKSTWCAFIRTMLYGLNLQDQSVLPERIRYAPWSGEPMEGTMDLTAEGFDMTLTRTTVSNAEPMQEFRAVYTGTENEVEGMNGRNCGELLTGVNREVFQRSAFIAQGGVQVYGNPDLEKRIESIVTSGEEKVSYAETAKTLEYWQRKRRNGRRGMLPELEEQMETATQQLRELETGVSSVRQLEEQLAKTQKECVELETRVTEARRRQRVDALERLRDGRRTVQERSDSHDEALAELSRRRDALRRSDFGDRSSEDLERELSADRAVLEEIVPEAEKKIPPLLPAVVCSVLAILAAAFYGVTNKYWMILVAAFCCVGSILFFMRYSRDQQSGHTEDLERERILRKYKISVPEDLDGILTRHREMENAIAEAVEEEKRSRARMDTAARQLRDLEESAVNDLDFAGGNSEAARLSRELTVKRNEASELAEKIAGLHGRLSAMGDPMVVSSTLSSMHAKHEVLQSEYEAITLAEELLREADKELRNRFSPELSRLAAQYMSEMTGGRYTELVVDAEFAATAKTADDENARDAGFLSTGTTDLLYLAVRLAVCELALPSGEPCPLIIDDALVNLDEKRYEQAMSLLKKIALERQVILFTCRRE